MFIRDLWKELVVPTGGQFTLPLFLPLAVLAVGFCGFGTFCFVEQCTHWTVRGIAFETVSSNGFPHSIHGNG